ncbi:CPBP family intramembrane glutamic endopeptidase [Candidatus Protochlamydia amoebophila]|uniref:CPBP family intramembrane glutamic endopeptidase n=1 Tax=Candidatus Protochlamydia amoebophila TaxID=362787 RepID=UPI001BCA0503|nr:CPBP family intramembrane glutamic endopeptidase [Candidatus Protochlamydia amoebophila]
MTRISENFHAWSAQLSPVAIQVEEIGLKAIDIINSAIVEMVKIIAVKILLEEVTKVLFSSKQLPGINARLITVVGPIVEEVFFRGMLQRGIGIIQAGWNRFVIKRELSKQEIMSHSAWRIHVTAIIFGLAHVNNSHSNYVSMFFQITWCYMGGVSYGYLSEKYQTLSVSILAHSINNILAISLMVYPKFNELTLLALVANNIAFCVLGTSSNNIIDETMVATKAYLSHLYQRYFVSLSNFSKDFS